MSLSLCGRSTNDFVRSGIVWEIDVNIVSCSSQNPPVTVYDITLVATDESGTMTTMQVQVPDPYANSDETIVDVSVQPVEEGLPAVSMLATLTVALLGAAMTNRGREE
jgi:hypothetical protein